jgi:SH3 domain protein
MSMKNKINKTIVFFALTVMSAAGVTLPTQVVAETRYVSDELKVPMRSGATNKHRILRFLKSGTQLKVLETDDDSGFSKIALRDGKEGWVENGDMMSQPSARDRIVVVNNKLSKSREAVKELKATIAELKTENTDLKRKLNASDKQGKALESDLAHLKKATANPLALANKNKALEDELNSITRLNKQLEDENKALADASAQDWFILGAAVSLGSLLFGLLITRIRWQKKRSWGDF